MSCFGSKMVTTTSKNQNSSWKSLYPFSTKKFKINNLEMNYVDEGSGPPVIMLHGNPTWSFFYRNVANTLKENHRCIVPDHIGCGLSDKPQEYNYTLENHISNICALIEHLKLESFSLIVHDWGGAIGMGVATRMPEKVKAMVIMNTAAFLSKDIPFSISICKLPYIGEKIVRGLNAFAWPATFMAPNKKMNSQIKAGYLYPYNNYENRIATARFVKDIPLKKEHESFETLKTIEDKLTTISCPKLFLWGAKDFCFNLGFLKRWRDFYPGAKYKILENAGHYLLEDENEICNQTIKDFLSEHSA